ncbi:MAG: HD domain-containing protein [Caldilineaceae bacterium]|nr:HD domain-containing protein [Caldilineaceae bacterium]
MRSAYSNIESQVGNDRTDHDEIAVDVSKITRKPWIGKRIGYRLRQFARGIVAQVRADEMIVVSRWLPKQAVAHFCQMPVDAQRHSLNVLYMLQETGALVPELAAAALLHDVGKIAAEQAGIHLSPWLRGPLVLLEKLAPSLPARFAVDDPAQGWRYALHVHLAHPIIGAKWAKEDGCSDLTCWLIEHHQDALGPAPQATNEKLLLLLQWADGRN